MAKTYTKSTNSYGGRYYKITLTQGDYDPDTGKINVESKFECLGGSSNYYSAPATYIDVKNNVDNTTTRVYSHSKTMYPSSSSFPVAKGSKTSTHQFAIDSTGNATFSVTFHKDSMSYGDTSWGTFNSTETWELDQTVLKPTVSAPSISSITRSSVYVSASVTSDGGETPTSKGIKIYNTSWSEVTSINSLTGTISGLTPNTNYYASAFAENSAGAGWSDDTSFKTIGNAPSITGVAHTPSRTGCSFAFTVTYETNDSKSSETIQYGTSTSYGSSTTSKSISGLAANTVYYYKITATSTQGRSSTYTNSFRTTGNVPTLSGVSATPSRTSATISYNASYDTNASYSSLEVQYGTSTSYGTSIATTSISNLTPNTTYYYRIRVTDNFSRTSSWSTGSFTTTGNIPSISAKTAAPSRTGCSFSITASYDTNASFSSREIQYGTSTSYGSSTTGTSISNLTPNTTYYYRVRVTDNFNRTSNWSTGNFTTTGNAPTISSGSVNNIKSKSATISVTDNFDTNARISSMSIKLYLNNTLTNTLTSTTDSKATGDILKPGKNYTAKITITDNWSRTSNEYTLTFKTKGGFKFNGKMSDSARLNGKEVIGMKFNGVEII